MEEEVKGAAAVVESLLRAVEEIAAISYHRNAYKKQFCNLSRRVRLLAPMFEELRESKKPISEKAVTTLASLGQAIGLAKELLRFGSRGSKISLVLDRDRMMRRFQEVTAQLEQTLGEISFGELDISDEVREQVELVRTQFKRAKERLDTSDAELFNDLSSVYGMSIHAKVDPVLLRRLAEMLQLTTIADLKQESLALNELLGDDDRDLGEAIKKMSVVLKKIEDYMQTQNPDICIPASAKVFTCDEMAKAPVVPDDFRCPISLELMRDPVIVSTGQTYERVFIEKWLKAGHVTCPKTQQKLSSTSLTPNHVIRGLIIQWCEENDMELLKYPAHHGPDNSFCSAKEHARVVDLILKLSSESSDDQRTAAAEIRLLAKCSGDNRVCIAEAGAIPLLVDLLSAVDSQTQEHAVTALYNLSINEHNKDKIIAARAVVGILHVLKRGSMEARENAAATLFSLSVVDANKVIIGEAGAIEPLVLLLNEGSQRGKRDAAAALFNLCIFPGNRGKVLKAGVMPTLMGLLMHPQGDMVDEALAILAILSSHPQGKVAIGAAEALPLLVELIRSGSPSNKENAATILVHLCNSEEQHLAAAQVQGVIGPLYEMTESGTDRGKRKAVQLLGCMHKFLEQQHEARDQVQSKAQAQARAQAPADQ
ncbi:protein spotted leaf 11-like [Musa acuminata AAA Group]|uniref:protein spotted leaf 11-like n=1 Tax=Musa acuminata AAA Group TaxID=214697 RepID=UPI0031D5BE95